MRAALERGRVVELASSAATGGLPLTLLVNDAHRFTATRDFLDVFFELLDGGHGRGPVTRLRGLVAAGTHVASAAEKLEHEERAFGSWRDRFESIAWHDAAAADQIRDVGGYRFHHWMAEGGCYLACGSVEPHYFAGAAGAHKTLTVGVMARESIEANHAGAMSPDARGLCLAGNPVHEGIAGALAALDRHGARMLAVNQVLVDGRVVAAAAGAPLTALEEALVVARGCFGHALSAPVDVVVAQMEPPLDRDVYQADKGIKNTESVVRDGGVLILEALCEQGVGIDHFVQLLSRAPTHDAALEIVRERGYRLGDHKAVRLRALTDGRGVRLAIVSPNIDPAMAPVLGATVHRDRKVAAAWAASVLPAGGAQGVLVEDAGNVTLELA